MAESTPSLLTNVSHPHHLQLVATASDSFLSPSSAITHGPSESTNRSYHHSETDDNQVTKKPRRYRSSLIEALRERFPDGPPEVYEDFIRVSLNEAPPESLVDEAAQEGRRTSASQKMSRLWNALVGSVASHPTIPSRPVISHPIPINAHPSRKRRSALTPSPVEYYTNTYTGVGPPPPLPGPEDLVDRPRSRNTTNSTTSYSCCEHNKHRVTTEITRPDHTVLPAEKSLPAIPAITSRPDVTRKNPVIFPSYAKKREKMVRIITPGTMQQPPMVSPKASPKVTSPPSPNGPKLESSESNTWLENFSLNAGNVKGYFERIVKFYDPAESLFVLGFITGPQTWLLGGYYLPSIDRREKKSHLRIWVDKQVQEFSDGMSRKRSKMTDELLERLERVSKGLESESFVAGRGTGTNSNSNGSRIDVLTRASDPFAMHPNPPPNTFNASNPSINEVIHQDVMDLERGSPIMIHPPLVRSSRAVWDGSSRGHKGVYSDDEISVIAMPSRWIYRCRVAAIIAGIVIMSLFITALTIVCLH